MPTDHVPLVTTHGCSLESSPGHASWVQTTRLINDVRDNVQHEMVSVALSSVLSVELALFLICLCSCYALFCGMNCVCVCHCYGAWFIHQVLSEVMEMKRSARVLALLGGQITLSFKSASYQLH